MERRLTGRQITTIALAVCVAVVAAPVSVIAAGSTLVNIVDPITGNKARVEAGAQRVGGTVQAQPTVPATPWTRSASSQNTVATITVPPGKRLVVESIAVSASAPTSSTLACQLEYTTGGQKIRFTLPMVKNTSFFGTDYWGFASPMRLYVDADSTITLTAQSPPIATTKTYPGLTIVGYRA